VKSIDVLMPVYQDDKALALSLASILAQDHIGPVRIVVYDDGSAPEAWARIQAVAAASRLDVDLHRGDVNRGRPHARNALLRLVKSDYVCWLDAGDEWPAAKLSTQYAALEAIETETPGKPVWLTSGYVMDWGGSAKANRQETQTDQIAALLEGKHLRAYLWTLMMPSWTLPGVGEFDPQLPRLQDLDYFVRFVLAGGEIVSAGTEPLAIYHKSDVGRDARMIRACSAHIFAKYRHLYHRYGRRFVSRAKYRNETLAARFAANNSQYGLAAYYSLRAIFRAPLAAAEGVARRLRGIRQAPSES
jgi:glycosyltransferase involved in cell wall biosynthesis